MSGPTDKLPIPPESAGPGEGAQESSLIQTRKEKRLAMKERGVNPYPKGAPQTAGRLSSLEIRNRFSSLATGGESPEAVHFCGRMMTRRDMGKASFAHLQDFGGRVQIYLRKDALGEGAYDFFTKELDLGDILGVQGRPFRTRTGELSLKVEELSLLSKSLRPMPEKWHGLKDVELRARQRELDLLSNPESRAAFELRARMIQTLRTTLNAEGYAEVETPVMQPVPGGAVARPFETYHNALGQKFYLRVAPELYLKRCLVGGFEKVFEIGRVFRNEGIDTLHNPEFTILEAYEAYGSMETMMALSEKLIQACARLLPEEARPFPADAPFARRSVGELFREYVGEKEAALVAAQKWAELAGGRPGTGAVYKAFDHIFSEKIQPHLLGPTFVTDFPADLSPLAKCKEGDPAVADRFELYFQGEEVANAYSELNDPVEQRTRLESYRRSRLNQADKEDEGMGVDESFLKALEYGMPPAGGLGIGVDRLVMLLAKKSSLRDVLLFPTLRPED